MKHTALIASLVLAGCVTVDPAAQQHLAETTPTCRDAKECELKWAAARTWVLNNAEMKIETYSADFIQTHNPPEYGTEIAVNVNKEPQPDGSYKIVAKVWCNNPFGCTKPPMTLAQSFNDAVNAVRVSP